MERCVEVKTNGAVVVIIILVMSWAKMCRSKNDESGGSYNYISNELGQDV